MAETSPQERQGAPCVQVASALRAVASATDGTNGHAFFRALAASLSAALGVRCVLVGEFAGTLVQRVRTLGVSIDGAPVADVEFGIGDIAPDELIAQGLAGIAEGVEKLLPDLAGIDGQRSAGYVASPLRDAEGDVVGLLAVVHDAPLADGAAVEAIVATWASRAGAEIERRRTEDALRTSEIRYRLLVEDAFDYVAEVVDERFVYVSPAYCDVLGYSDDDLLGGNAYELIHPDDRRLVADTAAREFREHTAGRVPMRLRSKDGSWRWTESVVRTFRTADGLRTMDFARDVTLRRLAEDVLRASEEQFRHLIADLNIGVVLQNARAEIMVSNRAAADLLGLTEDQLNGRTSFDPRWRAVSEDGSELPGEMHPVPRAIATGQPVRDFVMGVDRPTRGDRVWLLVTAEPRLAANGSVEQVVCTFIDVGARLSAEDERERFFELSLDVMCVLDGDGRLKRVNPAFTRAFGWSEAEVVGRLTRDLLHPDDAVGSNERRAEVRAGVPAPFYETRFLCKDGSFRLFRWRASFDPERGRMYATGRAPSEASDDAVAA